MKIVILRTGCYKCITLEKLVGDILLELGKTDVDVLRVGDVRQILRHISLDEIPGLLIDDILVCAHEIPPRETLVGWLSGVSMSNPRAHDHA